MAVLTTDWSDVEVRARLVAGDDRALALVLDRYTPVVWGMARRLTGDEGAADDICQDVFVSLWERPERFDPASGTLYTFLAVLARRRSIDWIRRRTAARRREDGWSGGPSPTPPDRDVLGDEAAARDQAARVRRSLASLPEPQRQAIELAYFGGLTYREVATVLGIPEGTAKARLRRDLARLAAVLAPMREEM